MSSSYNLPAYFSGNVVLSAPTQFYLGSIPGFSASFNFTDNSKLNGAYIYLGTTNGNASVLLEGDSSINLEHNNNPLIYIGNGGTGVLTVRDNALVSTRIIEIGGNGNGTLNLESGTIDALKSAGHTLPGFVFAGGIVNQSGGTLTTETMAIERYFTLDTSRMYNQTGGTLIVTDNLLIGRLGKHGVLNLSDLASASFATVNSATAGLTVGDGVNGSGEINIRDLAQLSVEYGKFVLGDGSQAVGTLNIDGGMIHTHALPMQLGANSGKGYVYQRDGEVHTAGVIIGSGSFYSFVDGDLSVFHSGTPGAIAGLGEFRDYGKAGTINTQLLGQANVMTARFYLDSSEPGVSLIQVSDTVNLSLVTVDTTAWGWANLFHKQDGGRYNLIDMTTANVTGSLHEGDNVLSPYFELKEDGNYVYLEFNPDATGGMEWQFVGDKFYVPETYSESGILKVSHDWIDGILATFSGLEGKPDLARHLVDFLNQGMIDSPVKFNYYGGNILSLNGDIDVVDPYTFFVWDLREFNAHYGLSGEKKVSLLSLEVPEPSTWILMIFGCVFLLYCCPHNE